MESGINLVSIYVTDSVGVVILLFILITRSWNLPARKDESSILVGLIIASMINCIVDLFIFKLDGMPGNGVYFFLLIGNTYLYFYTLIVGIGLLYIVVKHIDRKTQGVHMLLYWVLCVIEAGLLVVNFFYPLVFDIDSNNRYQRGDFYIVFVVIGYVLVLYGYCYYLINKIRSPMLRYFPVYEFLSPILLGNVIQMWHYGISLIPIGFALAFSSMVTALQNECIYIDKLTGAYNRYELDKLLKASRFRRSETIALLMLDINEFKSINVTFSHDEGDKLLIDFTHMLMEVVDNEGIVVRFSGDEFCIFIAKANKLNLNDFKQKIRNKIEFYNQVSGNPYKLSIAMGGKLYDLKRDNGDDLIRQVDALMRVDKAKCMAEKVRKERASQPGSSEAVLS